MSIKKALGRPTGPARPKTLKTNTRFGARPPGTIDVNISSSQSRAEAVAALVVGGTAFSAFLHHAMTASMLGDSSQVDTTSIMQALAKQGIAVASGDLSAPARMLSNQMVLLDGMFTGFLNKAIRADRPESVEAYMRIAQRAQSNCRATAEAITAMTHPPHPAVFAKQANITSGPQQINNHSGASLARVATEQDAPNKLLEVGTHDERVDATTARAAAASDPSVATVEILNGAANPEGEGDRVEKRLQGRQQTPPTGRATKRRASIKGPR